MIKRSKPQRSVVLIFCDFTHFIFNKLVTVAITRSVMMRLLHPLKYSNLEAWYSVDDRYFELDVNNVEKLFLFFSFSYLYSAKFWLL